MTTVHMICGYLGAGKTTFARKVEERERALRFSVDEMYLRLFADGPTYELDSAAMGRLLDVIEDHWTRAAVQGISVVLDLGFWNREFRERTRARAEELCGSTFSSVRTTWHGSVVFRGTERRAPF